MLKELSVTGRQFGRMSGVTAGGSSHASTAHQKTGPLHRGGGGVREVSAKIVGGRWGVEGQAWVREIVEMDVRRLWRQQGQGETEGIVCHSLKVKHLRRIQVTIVTSQG